MAKVLSFKHFTDADYTTDDGKDGKDPQVSYNAQKRRNGKYDEALDVQQRRKLAIRMKRNKARIAMGRKRAARKVANMDKLKKRARKQARLALYKKLVKGVPKSELSLARKKEIEKRLEKPQMQAKITRAARKALPKVRKAELAKKRGGGESK
jgi:hypothetical protein